MNPPIQPESIEPGALRLSRSELDIEDFEMSMDRHRGTGAYVVRRALHPQQLALVRPEFSRVPYRRGIFALKLTPDPSGMLGVNRGMIDQYPALRQLAKETRSLIHDLSKPFPCLADWTEDELALHRYSGSETGAAHKSDNERFYGLIGVITLSGVGHTEVVGGCGDVADFRVDEGDLMLIRASGLFMPQPGGGEIANECNDYRIASPETATGVSCVVRANSRPFEPVPGFVHDNWPRSLETMA